MPAAYRANWYSTFSFLLRCCLFVLLSHMAASIKDTYSKECPVDLIETVKEIDKSQAIKFGLLKSGKHHNLGRKSCPNQGNVASQEATRVPLRAR